MQRRRVVLPGAFDDFIVGDFAVLREDFFAVFLIRAIAVHTARESPEKAQGGVALLRDEGSRRDHRAVDIFDAELAEIHQLAHAHLGGLWIERVTQGDYMHGAALQRGKRFGLRAQAENRDILVGL